ncbi:MAG: hypothetical protein MMC23_006326 [Stictis urceolatum]|nr:hypothetical protein [Stictis urceolata]
MPPVRQSASKEEFLKALGLDSAVQDDREKFASMWDEVTKYWMQKFEIDDRRILKTEYASNGAVKKPYKWAHLRPEYIDACIKEIWSNGGYYPRRFYDVGRTDDQKVYNWVLKWLLWHVCRYRDWRNRKNRPSSATPIVVDTEPPHDYWKTIMDGRP